MLTVNYASLKYTSLMLFFLQTENAGNVGSRKKYHHVMSALYTCESKTRFQVTTTYDEIAERRRMSARYRFVGLRHVFQDCIK